MVKKLIILVVVLAALGAGAYILSGNSKNDETAATMSTSTTKEQETKTSTSENGNIYSLADGDKARKCTFSYAGSQGTSVGKMYSDGKGNGLMTIEVTTSKGTTSTSNTLVLTDKVYGWTKTDKGSVGFVYDKSALTSKTNTTNSSSSSSNSTANPDKDFKLSCQSWNVDESLFVLPTDVHFTSLPNY